MALKDGNNNSTGSAQPFSFNTAQQTNTTSNNNNNGNNTLSFSGTRDMVPRNQSSEYLTTVLNKWKEGIKIAQTDLPNEIKLSVFALDRITNSTSGIYLSSIIVTATVNNNTYYHTLLLANTNQKIAPIQEQSHGKNIEIVMVYSDVINTTYIDEVYNFLSNKMNGILTDCGSSVLPQDFNINDNDACNKAILVSLLATVANNGLALPIEFNLFNLDEKSVSINVQYTNDHVYSLLGSPIRSDVVITTSTNKNGGNRSNNKDINSNNINSPINKLTGYIDQAWKGNDDNSQYGNYQNRPSPKLQARFIITSVENLHFSNLSSTLFTISSSLILGSNRKWYNYYLPKSTLNNQVDIKDFGFFNIDVAVTGEHVYIDTKSSDYTNDDLFKLINLTCYPELNYSIDCSKGGDDTSIGELFIQAVDGNNLAIQMIINAANSLTNNQFSKYFNSNMQIFSKSKEVVYLGTYEDSNGNKRDIRELDYLAVLALSGGSEPNIGTDYTNTINNEQYDLHLRMHEKRKIESNLLKGNYTITDKARRCTFTGDFLNALQQAILDCNLNIIQSNPTYGGVISTQRSTYGLSTQSSVTTNVNFIKDNSRGYTPNNNNGWNTQGRRFQ